MDFSNNLIEQFVRTTKNNGDYSVDYTVQGTIVVYGDSKYVKLDGSELLTPISSTTEIGDGDRVMVRLKNHTAIVTGNISDPAVGKKRADGLASEISQTVEEIRLSVSAEVAKLESSITMTADGIRSEVSDEINGLESRIEQNANQISTIVSNQEGFSEFKQTVEGFSFMNSGGTVKISHGDINLTGAITFGDLSEDVSDEIESASTAAESAASTARSASEAASMAYTNATNATSVASSAYYQAGDAIAMANTAKEVADAAKQLAESMELPSYLKSTYIDSTVIMSPVIVGGAFYAVGQTAWTNMTANGLYMYTNGIADSPKFSVVNDNTNIVLRMGAGTYVGDTPPGTFVITKSVDQVKLTYHSGIYPNMSANLIFNDLGQIIARRIAGDGTTSAVTIIGN